MLHRGWGPGVQEARPGTQSQRPDVTGPDARFLSVTPVTPAQGSPKRINDLPAGHGSLRV